MNIKQIVISLFFLLMLFSFSVSGAEKMCTYSTYKWNTISRKAVDFKTVQHPYSDLQSFEIDEQTGCTVCEEDQVVIQIGDLPAFKVCKHFAFDIENTLNQLWSDNQPVNKIVAYRVGMTRGEVDEQGNRTGFSNHSFGIALDINDEQNGLYDQCITFNENCRLRKGGKWSPDQFGSLTPDSEIVKAFKSIGLKWGGEIAGKQKDFMHFSPTGY